MQDRALTTDLSSFLIPSSYDPLSANDLNKMVMMEKQEPLSSANLNCKTIYDDIEFEDPMTEFFNMYQDFMMENTAVVLFKDSWVYRPQFASMEIYATPFLYPLLMYINNVKTNREFNKKSSVEGLLVLQPDAINKLRGLALHYRKKKLKQKSKSTPYDNLPLKRITIY